VHYCSHTSREFQMAYYDFMVFTVPANRTDEYKVLAAAAGKIFIENGATRVLETVQDDVPHGKLTDFYRAVDAKEDDLVFSSIIEWPSKEVRDIGNKKTMEHPDFNADIDWPFNMKTIIFGGFSEFVETK
jgi:uncharacterized protein YbaA (DUF1428 family)